MGADGPRFEGTVDTTDGELQAGLVRPRLLGELLLRSDLAARLAAHHPALAAMVDLARHGWMLGVL